MTPQPSTSSKPRRSHRKSRNGCLECKKRHIRCDEGRPECSHCVRAERACSYLKPRQVLRPGVSDMDEAASQASPSAVSIENEVQHTGPTFSIIHMTLLHHAGCHMSEFMGIQGQSHPMIAIAIDNATVAPYLLDQLLALSALHLSAIDTAKSSLYHYQATELQTRALGLYNQLKAGISDANCIPTFLFASLLGIHVLRETLSSHRDGLAVFLDDFVRYAHLHRGVRAITAESWTVILESSLKPLLFVKDVSEKVDKNEPGTETNDLNAVLESMQPRSPYIGACQEALRYVQWVLDICKLEPTRLDMGVHSPLAWPVVVPEEYFDALEQHRPEALVVFAFYAATLHRCENFWVFQDAGSSLVRMVVEYLGDSWRANLEWPLVTIGESWDKLDPSGSTSR
ncbi:hypothetical protein B0T10DRAFT_525989 [Thelonectria olida]|uniref:Zn(2)-C6 fungal-type domain-containing protein n=1 Tax=Thelonectria olida TaxID=1576542 RepID=A0A9P9AWR7_9HYPO|nr:hypothetical protein B0T10DRAFT_525989 [Thelonectria olida]